MACLYHDLISGGVQTTSGKYARYVNQTDLFGDYMNAFNEYEEKNLDFKDLYLKYKKELEYIEKDNCIVKVDNVYVKKVTSKHLYLNYSKSEAKKFNDKIVIQYGWFKNKNAKIEMV